MWIKDQLYRECYFSSTPKRIVCLVPSITELICDLGLESALVGVTKFCVHPQHIRKQTTVVGGTKQVHYHKIRDLNPDIILCNKEENTQEMIAELEAIAPVHISDINTIANCIELIRMYGQVFNCAPRAEQLAEKIATAKTDFEKFTKTLPTREVAYFIWKDPWMLAANNTFIHYMLELNKFTNAFAHKKRYPELAPNTVYAHVDFVFLSSEPYPFKDLHKDLIHPQFPNAHVELIDGEMFSWYGSRLLLAFSYFKKLHNFVLRPK
ncbi:ABC transporter substrate-binding protein [Bizionia sediminis]|uniref:ABC transporter substrate-binding protein n=1 Tax=Bizionia sediminis TaxID=1737064 RepID=A0ABW5KPN6_9FLAO